MSEKGKEQLRSDKIDSASGEIKLKPARKGDRRGTRGEKYGTDKEHDTETK